MGCSSSKLDDEEAVQLCKDRKNFIKKAVEHRTRFASGHMAYLRSLKRLSAALKDYVEGDEPREFSLDSFTTPLVPTTKKITQRFVTISPNSFTIEPKVNYLRAGGVNPTVFVQERPPGSPETVRVESFNQSSVYQYATDSFFPMQPQSPPLSIFHSSRPNLPPPSPQRSSQWDFFWNPFSSLDYYGYPATNSDHQSVFDDDINGLQQVREEEGIPELEEETEQEETDNHRVIRRAKVHVNCDHEDEVTVEDVDDDDEFETDGGDETETEHEAESPPLTNKSQNLEVSKAQNLGEVSNNGTAEVVSNQESAKIEGTPGFTVYVNRRPTSMSEVIKDLEAQFTIIFDSAKELSAMLEANRAHYSSTSHELTAMKILNPVALLRSASSSRSNSSRFLMNSSGISKDEGYASSSDLSDESSLFHNSHQSTLDKLYAWEKKLYQEVKAGERVRIAYEKKCVQLRNHDIKGDDYSSVHKTRTAIRDLHTQIKVSIHSVEAVSKRIETLMDQELQPQLLELIQGLSRMWKVMAECHQNQKRTLDEAKMLLAGTPSKPKYTPIHSSEPHRLSRSASNLEAELQNWKSCFESWITSQRSYIHAITGWLLRCTGSNSNNTSKFPFSPRRSTGGPPMFGACMQWSRLLDSISEVPVLDGLDFFAAGVGSLYVQKLKEGGGGGSGRTEIGSSRRYGGGSGMEMVESGRPEEEETAEKMAEVAIKVLCAGMSVVVSSLTEFALCSAQGYSDLVKQWESAKCPEGSSGAKG
ncbi:nitrate regulatory gene2 protein-like [Cynara cardunculus var. scolymus]|uniref:nitrate regulatory gene2 protein-like n=1 Tax=Cynara cardunculus var. scolymus TaxID=59895 RepID=UPI000D62DC51|nr:nitrate regulatory gene2 protein-like [Cynara cardunculus var. scolymus]